MSEQSHRQPYNHDLQHHEIRGDDIDKATHIIDAFASPRIVDELVTLTKNGKKIYGEVFAVVTPDHTAAERHGSHPVDQLDSLCLVRYPDTQQVGIASRAYRDGEPIMHPGMVLTPDERILFGREGDIEGAISERGVLGRVALTGVQGAVFGRGVSRLHGSVELRADGRVVINDGFEETDPDTRHIIDRASANHTRVTVAGNVWLPRHDLIKAQKVLDREDYEKRRFGEVFGAPQPQAADRFGNKQDRLSSMTDESIRDAQETLKFIRDKKLTEIIERHFKGVPTDPESVVTAIRTNDELRFEIARYLVEKAKIIAYMLPERLQDDRHSKNPNHPGYPSHMDSKEYAALLAISMLDGTFISARSKSDKVEFVNSNTGSAINGGQHRLAALRLLDLGENAPKHVESVRIYR